MKKVKKHYRKKVKKYYNRMPHVEISDVFKELPKLVEGETLTVEYSDGITELIRKEAQKAKIGVCDVVERAAALYFYAIEELRKKKGLKLSITTEKDEVLKDILLGEK